MTAQKEASKRLAMNKDIDKYSNIQMEKVKNERISTLNHMFGGSSDLSKLKKVNGRVILKQSSGSLHQLKYHSKHS